MHLKPAIATISSILAFICCLLIILGILGIIDLQAFAIGSELGVRVLLYIAVASLLFVAILYYKD